MRRRVKRPSRAGFSHYGRWERYRVKPLKQRFTRSETTEEPTRLAIDGAPAHARRWGRPSIKEHSRPRSRHSRLRRRR